MQLSNSPGKLVLPFANSGNKNAIPVNSQIGITPGAASLADGFPPLTMTPVAAGGVPPSGLDMNGILFQLSAILRWANAGGGYAYDSTFANNSNVGGYPKGARIMRSDGLGYWFNTVENNTTDPEAAGAAAAGWVPDFTNGATSVAMSSANVTLTPLQYGKPIIVITGMLTANLNLIFPPIVNEWTVINKTTGSYTITCKTAAGTGIVVNTATLIVGDGTNIQNAVTDAVVSVKDFGAVGDGVTDDTAAFQAAIDSFNAIGGQLKVPASVYRIDGTVTGYSNIHLAFESGAVIDGSHTATGPIFLFAGTTGASVNLGVNATRGDTSLTTAADHGLVTGDWFLLVSQRDCLSPDAGDWRLGSTGPTSSREYFGEAKQVATAPTSATLTMREGLTFPNYRTDLTQETEATSTHVAYLQKINFLAGVKITGGKFIVRGNGADNQRVAIKLAYCLYPEVNGIDADLGIAPGRCIMSVRCLGGTFNVSASRTPGWTQAPYPGIDHNQWNSFVDSSGWYNHWKISDINGGQGLDVTYTNYVEPIGYLLPYVPSIGITVTGRTINNRENSVTWHWGSYQGLIHDMVSINSGGEGIFVRSRMVDIVNPYVVNTGSGLFSSQSGIYIQGWATDLSITGGTVQGYPYGVRFEQIGNATFEQGPELRNVRINGATISNCTYGVYAGNYRSRNTNTLSGIKVENCSIADCMYGVYGENYVSGIYIDGVQFSRMRENSRLVSLEPESYGHRVQNVELYSSPASVIGVYKDLMTDTTVFSGPTYLNNQVSFDFKDSLQSINPRNNVISNLIAGPKITTSATLVPQWMNGKLVHFDGLNLALTIPKVTSGVPVLPPSGQIELFNLSSTPVTIALEAGVTMVVKSSHTKIMPYGKVTIRCRYENNWVMFGDTQA